MNKINRLTVSQMSRLTGLSEDVIQRRLREGKAREYEGGQYRVKFNYIMPHYGKDGLISSSWLGKRMMMSGDTIRKRLLKNLKAPDYVLEDGNTYLWKNEPRTHQAAHVDNSYSKVIDIKKSEACSKKVPSSLSLFDDDEPMVYKGDALRLVTEERRKRQWIGKKGVLFDGRQVIAEGTIENVTSMGVIVDGVNGKLWMLGLKDEVTED